MSPCEIASPQAVNDPTKLLRNSRKSILVLVDSFASTLQARGLIAKKNMASRVDC